jgi:acetyltransferase-like isoleucine patch superfamily enzyme
VGSVIGANAVLYRGVALGRNVLIGDGATIRENSIVDDNSIIGNNVTMQNSVYVGRNSRVLDLSHITAHVSIGDNVFISVSVMTMNDNSMAQGGELLPPQIFDGARVGGGALILPGVAIGENALVAAGSVVTKSVDANIRVQGIPAKRYGLPVPQTDDQIWSEAYFEAGTFRSPDGFEPADR